MPEKIYIPKGKDILTANGCTCKNEYKTASGKTIKNACNIEAHPGMPWCAVKGKCGIQGGNVGHVEDENQWYDKCTLSTKPHDIIVHGKHYFHQNMIGIIIYISIFVIIIPIILYKYKFYEFLEVYMPNFDLLATAVSFGGGPGGKNERIFQELYNTNSNNLMGQTSTVFINYISLLGLTYLVARSVKVSKSIAKGWGMGFIALFFTYLVPNGFISAIQKKFASYFLGLEFDFTATLPQYLIVVSLGLVIAGAFISIERAILDNHEALLDPIIKQILHITDFLDKMLKM